MTNTPDLRALVERLEDCPMCNGEGWRWSYLARREVPCLPCLGMGFRKARSALKDRGEANAEEPQG